MAAPGRWIVWLGAPGAADASRVGGKAATLAKLASEGFRVPGGFCVTVDAYERFVSDANLHSVVEMELGRKPLGEMRWEEIWDAALRIRSAFTRAAMPDVVSLAVHQAALELGAHRSLAVRSSAPGEDSTEHSFAGLHETHLGVVGPQAVLRALRRVWSSLWSDAALLYRRELRLDPVRSRMAVVVQEVVSGEPSGVAFGRDPRDPTLDRSIIEAVSGPCGLLVDGRVEPDRWTLERSTGLILQWRPGERTSPGPVVPLLDAPAILGLHRSVEAVERAFGWPPDVEWTRAGEGLTLLQARPVTAPTAGADDTREWYLSLRPGNVQLAELSRRVSEELIPELRREGDALAAEPVERLDDLDLASAIEARRNALERWRTTYHDEFIPFAHGVRSLGTYYNDALGPRDPYEFVGLLQGGDMLATSRNGTLQELATRLARNRALLSTIETALTGIGDDSGPGRIDPTRQARAVPGGEAFVRELDRFACAFMDVSFAGQRLNERTDSLWPLLVEMARSRERDRPAAGGSPTQPSVELLERRLFDAVGEERRQEAHEVLRIARLSWALRDDDNLLLARLESQLLRTLNLAAVRLRKAGRLSGRDPGESDLSDLVGMLRDPARPPLSMSGSSSTGTRPRGDEDVTPRQLVGQPAAPGYATGRVKRVRDADDFAGFGAGSVLVCDAVQPNMTHLVPLARAVVERRGGMLIHGAIIARELGIPCVNGISRVADVLADGDLVTVDGHLGIVTVGATDFQIEEALSVSER